MGLTLLGRKLQYLFPHLQLKINYKIIKFVIFIIVIFVLIVRYFQWGNYGKFHN